MSGDIVLSPGIRQNPLALQNTAQLQSITQERLATGKMVNSAFDDPSSYFNAQSLNSRAGDLNALLDQIGQARQTLQAANNGLTSLASLLRSAKSIATQAEQATSATHIYAAADGLGRPIATRTGTVTSTTRNAARAALQQSYNDLLTQIDSLAKDSSHNGINLLYGDNLEIFYNENGTSSQTIQGVTLDSNGLGLAQLDASQFRDNSQIDAVIAAITAALNTVETQASTFGSNLATIQTRQDFTKDLVTTLQTGADNLVLADPNLEGANMLALQRRQQLSGTVLSLANQASQAVLKLFG